MLKEHCVAVALCSELQLLGEIAVLGTDGRKTFDSSLTARRTTMQRYLQNCAGYHPHQKETIVLPSD